MEAFLIVKIHYWPHFHILAAVGRGGGGVASEAIMKVSHKTDCGLTSQLKHR